MPSRAIFVAAALLAATLVPAAADSVTGVVVSWDAQSRTIILGDGTQYQSIPAPIQIPETLKAGDEITINYLGSEDGVQAYINIEVATSK